MKQARVRRFLGICLVVLFALGIGATRLTAQVTVANASLSGAVYDNTQALVPGALVTVKNPDIGLTRTFTTGPDGLYTFASLPLGTYTLTVEKQGFHQYQQLGILLGVAQGVTQDVTLQIGAVSETVTVTAGAPLLETTSANVSTNLNARQLTDLPLNYRNVVSMMFTNSSANNSAQWQILSGGSARGIQDGDIGFMNFGGGRFGTTAYMVDGQWITTNDWDAIIWIPSVDETAEMKVQTHTFTSQYGLSSGNVVTLVTKSGTSALHGDAYEFLHNSALDANTFFNDATGLSKPPFRRNQFGFTLGGPIYIPHVYEQRDRTFFFVSFEGNRESEPASELGTMPTTDFRTGNFSALLGSTIGTDCLGRPVLSGQIYNPFTTRSITAGQMDTVTGITATCTGKIRDPFAGNLIPSGMINSVASNMLKYFPATTLPGISNNWSGTGPLAMSYTGFDSRIDHTTDKSRVMGRFAIKPEMKGEFPDEYGTSDVGGPGANRGEWRFDSGLQYVRNFNTTTVMTVSGGWGRWDETLNPQGGGVKPSSLGFPSALDSETSYFPSVSISGTDGLGSGSFTVNPREVRSLAVDFTKIHGSQTWTFGFMGISHQTPNYYTNDASYNFGQDMTQGPDPTAANPSTGWGFASFLLGTGDGGGLTTYASSMNYDKSLGFYFQDDWKLTRKLTVNLGLRYEFQGPSHERFQRNAWFNFTDPNPISTNVGFNVPGHIVYEGPSGLYNVQHDNFAPRIGLAYQISPKLVMRTGFGMYYTLNAEVSGYQNEDLFGFTETTPYVGTVDGITPVDLLDNPFPGGLISPPGKSQGALTNVGLSVDAWERNRQTPYMLQWTYGLQYQLTPNDMIEATYVGNRGVKLLFDTVQKDELNPAYLSEGDALLAPVTNPFYGSISSSSCGLNSPTVPAGQLLRPFPEFCGVGDSMPPAGFSTYNALDITYTHRWSQGLQVLASFTASKFLDDSVGDESWTIPGWGDPQNYYDLSAEKALDGDDIPKSFVLTYIYQMPVGRGKHFAPAMNRPLNAVLGGWEVSGVTTFKSGFPLSINDATNNSNSFGGSQRPNLIGDPHVSHPTIAEWFNTAAFAQPAAFTFGDVSARMPNLRAPGTNTFDLGIQKMWNAWQDKFRAQFRFEMFNLANHPQFFAPNETFGSPTFGVISSAYQGRTMQLALKLFW